MLYSFGHPMQLCGTLFYSRVGSGSNFPATFLCWLGVEKLKNFFLCKLRQLCSCSPRLGCAFLMFLTCVRLLVLQSSGEDSEVEGSFCDDDGEFSVFRIFLKKCCIVLYKMLHSFDHLSVKHDQTTCNNVQQVLYDVLWNVVLVWSGLNSVLIVFFYTCRSAQLNMNGRIREQEFLKCLVSKMRMRLPTTGFPHSVTKG